MPRAENANRLHSLLHRAAPWVALFVLTIAAYIPALSAGFIWDDSDHVPQSPFQQTTTALKWVWTKLGATPQYYPLTHTVFWLESHMWGKEAMGYHVVNILIHAGNGLLLFALVRRLQIGQRTGWLAAAIFLLHPINVESVAWVTELKNTLSGCFYLSAALLAVRAWRLDESGAPSAWPRWFFYAGAIVFFIAAVLSKTVTCTFPAAFVVVLWWKRGRVGWKDIVALAPMFLIALGAAKLTSGMEQWNVGAVGPDFQFTLADRILIAGRAVWFYVGKLLNPHPLAFIYPRWEINPHQVWQWAFPIAAGLLVLMLAVTAKRIGRGPLTAALFFVGTLFPALGFVDVYPMRFSFVADHFQYLAGIGLIVPTVWLVARVFRSTRKFALVAAVIVLDMAAFTFEQSRWYHDETTLWFDTLNENPTCWLAMNNLAAIRMSKGNFADADKLLDQSLAIHPDQMEAHLSKGLIFVRRQDWPAAQREYALAKQIKPGDARPVHRLASLFAAKGDLPAAEREYVRALTIEPRLESARMEYVRLLRATGRAAQAEQQCHAAIEANPESVDARVALASMHYQAGDTGGAIVLMSEAIDINPSDANAHNTLGVFLMQANHPAEAAEQFEAALAIDPNFAEAHDGLGNALAAWGKTREAADEFREAIKLKPDFAAARQHLQGISPGQ